MYSRFDPAVWIIKLTVSVHYWKYENTTPLWNDFIKVAIPSAGSGKWLQIINNSKQYCVELHNEELVKNNKNVQYMQLKKI